MDSITQAALGGVVGELVLGRKIGWKGMAWGLLFGTMPDLDVFFSPFMTEAEQLKWHRGISHSLVMMFIATLVFAKPLSLVHRRKGVSLRRAGWFVLLAWSTHVLIDVFTTYGTQIWEPFSDARVSLNNLFIIDPLFTLPLLICVLITIIRLIIYLSRLLRHVCSSQKLRRPLPEEFQITGRGARLALTLSSLYVLFSFIMKMKATDIIGSRMAEEIPGAQLRQVAPTPANTILWRGLAETDDGFWTTYYSPFDQERPQWDYFPKHRELAEPFKNQDLFKGLEWFSRGRWIAREGPNKKIIFIDMRFGEVRIPQPEQFPENDLKASNSQPLKTSGQQIPMFQWHMSYDQDGNFEAPMMRPRTTLDESGKESALNLKASLTLIMRRLFGNLKKWQSAQPF